MPLIRPFTPDDVPAVAALRERVFRQRRRSGAALQAYLRRLFFESPWQDPELPAHVAEEDGTVVGFIGVVPRPLTRGGERLRGAVATQVMVAPEKRGMLGLRLVQRAIGGAQDVLYADVINPAARDVWERAGGSTAALYGFQWTRALRPARYAAAALGPGTAARAVRVVAAPLLRAVDARAAPTDAAVGFVTEEMPDLAPLAELLPRMSPPTAVLPLHEPGALAWLQERAGERWPDERVRSVLVRGPGGEAAGWFAYLDGGGGTAQVLHLFAPRKARAAVLAALFRHARAGGASAVRGRADPAWLTDVSAAGCRWERGGEGLLVHARRPELLAAFLRGDAVLGGMDGEWWMDF